MKQPGSPAAHPPSLILIGGPSGVGKSRLAHALARRTSSTVAQIDDMQTTIEELVPPERLTEYFIPSTTYLRTDSAADINAAIEQVCAFFAPPLSPLSQTVFRAGPRPCWRATGSRRRRRRRRVP
jgi:hypothetical protein